mgnify:CR=1 FL=1
MTRRYGRRYENRSGYASGNGGYGGGRSYGAGRYRRDRRGEERQVEFVTLGLVLLVFAAQFLFNSITPQIVLLLGGIIILGGAFYQVQRRWRVNPITWIGGAAMLIFGVIEMQTNQAPLGSLLPLLLFGGVIIASFVTGEF